MTFESLLAQYGAWFESVGVFLVTLLAVSLLGHLTVRPAVSRVLTARNPNNPTLVNALEQYTTVLFVIVAIPLATTAAGFGGLVAGSTMIVAAGTLAVGVAGQDVIGNLVSGLFLVADPDFNVGDYIEWNGEAGTVERIDLRVTRVRTPADEVLTVPNTQLSTNAIRTPFSRGKYRLTERVLVGYDTDLDTATEVLLDAADADDRLASDPEPVVHVTSLGENAIELSARVWVDDPRTADVPNVDSAFATRVKRRLQAADVSLAPASAQRVDGRLDVSMEGER
ncbi:mechanosensitive ion channel family protein [Salarchaeum sp. JOR-1]|uniref:mechanosensitive ion channel family protein n=1 Tax=Salarchaeum sp. JOR-1 TaxID=2599399 RepID=UPI00143D5A40|nr:mechanosensitive ion channel domain-containing protein [Salarchaeum sp. JOR-1]